MVIPCFIKKIPETYIGCVEAFQDGKNQNMPTSEILGVVCTWYLKESTNKRQHGFDQVSAIQR
jgi:hypothetical protein